MKDVVMEPVESITMGGHTMKVGRKMRCTCEYECTAIYPVWYQNGVHVKDSPHNSAAMKQHYSVRCPVHAKYAQSLQKLYL